MPTTTRIACGFTTIFLTLLSATSALAVRPSDTLLPRSTKGYVSVAHPKEFNDRWNKTQIGQMFNDEVMKAFVDDFHKQIRDDFGSIEKKLGFVYDDVKDVSSGEMSFSIIERKDRDAALAVTMDVTGHANQADGFLAAIEKRFKGRNGRKTTDTVDGTTLQIFTVPTQSGKRQVTVYFIKDNVLCGVDDRGEAEAMLKRFDGNANDNLKSIKAYQATMERCRREAGKLEPEVRWFIEPFGFIFATRTLQESPVKHDPDMAKILYNNGFDAIQGAGGFVNQLVDNHIEFLSRVYVYAPADSKKAGDPLRWRSSMRMMQLPNGPAVEPQSWAPRELASYFTMNLNLTDAFDNVGPVFDAIQDHEDAWKNTLDGWKNDPYGQQVDVRKEFIANMGNRVTVMSSYDVPISEDSERAVFAIEAKNEKALAATLEKWMSKEPDVVRRQVGQYTIWERVKNRVSEEPDVDVPAGFSEVQGSNQKSANEKKRKERVLPNSAVTVALGHMMMASDINYLTDLLQGFGQHERLASSIDYQQMVKIMNDLAPGERCSWVFGRSDEEVRPTFDLIRDGKMPQSKSMLGKLLNKLLTTADEKRQGVPRRQRINGANLPDFEAVRRYFGPHASVARSEKDGWFITDAMLNTEAP
ncbi:MAG TPA: hypothetical protein VFW73_01930 [Lacipirellulaceae bacterium]|nr:hypothetical protein [Lacipirellulaceae bacterium]